MQFFIIPLAAMVISQGIKMLVELAKGNFSWSLINSYGGMPSSHAALASSLAYTVAYFEGVANPAFAVSVILLIIIVRDATGYRFQLGVHSKIINKLVKELPDREEYKFPVLSERLGHTVYEVGVGVLLGIVLSELLILLYY